MIKRLCTAALVVWTSACGGSAHHLTVENVSDEELHLEAVSAPEFEFPPPVGVLGRGHQGSGFIMKTPPSQVTITERGKPPVVVRVPSLPEDANGEITLHVIYTRSRQWATAWEIIPERDADRIPTNVRRIPEDADPRFRQFRALIAAAEAGNVADVDRLITQGAPLSWDTTGDSPLVSAAGRQRHAVIERLLRDHASAFALPDIEEAIWRAADPNEPVIAGLRLLVGKFGARLTPAARIRILRKAAESTSLKAGRIEPAGPAVRYLIDEAGFDVNLPISDQGDTLLDLIGGGNEHFRDDRLLSYLKTRGAVSGRKSP
jgi:hypothetical protein